MTAVPTSSRPAQVTGTNSAARTKTGCPLTPQGCDTPATPSGPSATSRTDQLQAHFPNPPGLTTGLNAIRDAPEPPIGAPCWHSPFLDLHVQNVPICRRAFARLSGA